VFYHAVERFAGTPVNLAFEQIRWVGVKELLTLDILEGNREAIDLLLRDAQHRPLP
jgi:hypothetical protein